MSSKAACIYCSEIFDPAKGEGDHVFPASLGEFNGLKRFRGACLACNGRFGQAEEQLLRCGPEAFMLRVAAPPRRRASNGNAWPGAHGAPPPSHFTMRHGVKLKAVPLGRDPRVTQTEDQIVVIEANGNQHQIPVNTQMNAQAVRQKIKNLSINDRITLHINISEPSWLWFESIRAELWPDNEMRMLPQTQAGMHLVPGLTCFKAKDHYFRALAKMAFHYYLCYGERGCRGNEATFAPLREFLTKGGDSKTFFKSPRTSSVYFGSPFGDLLDGDRVTPTSWFHLLAFDDTGSSIVVFLQLFLGPGYANPPYYVELGPTSSAGIMGAARAHMLSWLPDESKTGLTMEVPISRMCYVPIRDQVKEVVQMSSSDAANGHTI